jgi:uncharacterized protein (DUF302 family)
MRRIAILAAMLLVTGVAQAHEGEGMVTLVSPHSVAKTVQQLKAALHKKGMTLFKVVDHAAGARRVGLKMPETTLVIFGNPKVGTPVMLCAPSAAIDFPQKMLIRQDAKGKVLVSYNSTDYLRKRHDIKNCTAQLDKIKHALAAFAKAAVAP